MNNLLKVKDNRKNAMEEILQQLVTAVNYETLFINVNHGIYIITGQTIYHPVSSFESSLTAEHQPRDGP